MHSRPEKAQEEYLMLRDYNLNCPKTRLFLKYVDDPRGHDAGMHVMRKGQ
jgi:hypothetical protein